MQQQHLFPQDQPFFDRMTMQAPRKALASAGSVSRQAVIGALLITALLAFELFNFDTTRFALANLLGDVSFVGVRWASILALAFCAIDFAGLAHLFGPNRAGERSVEGWYLMGAWLLGATMNAVMTWWAVNITLISHDLGNEVLSRQQLLEIVPAFVAVLVWLTRILFIGAFSVAGEQFLVDSSQSGADSRGEAGAQPVVRQSARHADRQPLRDPQANIPSRPGADFRAIRPAPHPSSLNTETAERRRRQRV